MLRCLIPAQVDPVLGWLHDCTHAASTVAVRSMRHQAPSPSRPGPTITCQALVKGAAGPLVVLLFCLRVADATLVEESATATQRCLISKG